MRTALWSIVVTTAFLFSSCEERQVVIPDFVPPDSDRVVLLEELTGVSCPNCPGGSAEIKRLQERFPGNLVSVAYHTNFLGFPRPESQFDFRSQEAQNLEGYLGDYVGKPTASVNRVIREDSTVFNSSTGEWSGFVSDALNTFAALRLEGSVTYNDETRIADIEFLLTPKRDLGGEYKLTVLAKESKIIDAQLFPENVTQLDYEHNHVFRTFLSNFRGDQITQSLEQSRTLRFDYSLDLEGEWVPENMHIVAFVEYQESGRPVEILQAMEIPLIQ